MEHKWTTEQPTESGYYWFKDEDGETHIFEWDTGLEWAWGCGGDVPYTHKDDNFPDLQHGLWWTEKIKEPK